MDNGSVSTHQFGAGILDEQPSSPATPTKTPDQQPAAARNSHWQDDPGPRPKMVCINCPRCNRWIQARADVCKHHCGWTRPGSTGSQGLAVDGDEQPRKRGRKPATATNATATPTSNGTPPPLPNGEATDEQRQELRQRGERVREAFREDLRRLDAAMTLAGIVQTLGREIVLELLDA